jgi:hypothetical protein
LTGKIKDAWNIGALYRALCLCESSSVNTHFLNGDITVVPRGLKDNERSQYETRSVVEALRWLLLASRQRLHYARHRGEIQKF